MSDFRLVLSNELKMKFRESKTLVKNYFKTLIPMLIFAGYFIFKFGQMIVANGELIDLYKKEIFLGISIIVLAITLFYKKIPLEWHPGNMIHLMGCKFKIVFKISLLKKAIIYLFSSILIASIIVSSKFSIKTLQIALSLWNLFLISSISRYFIYNKGLNIKILAFLFAYTALLNIQLYTNKYIAFILILSLTYVLVLSIRKALNMNFNFNKSFNEMVYINRVNFIAREMLMMDMQEIVREKSSKKSRGRKILRNIKFKNPLNQKNLLTFSRINTGQTLVIFGILILLVLLYRLEIFTFIKTLKELNLGIPIVVLHQTMFVNNVVNIINEQKNLLLVKRKEGLYLPYENREIIKSFLLLGIPIIFIGTLIIGIILQIPFWIIGLATLLYSIVFLIYLSFKRKKANSYFNAIIYFLVFGISYLFIGLN